MNVEGCVDGSPVKVPSTGAKQHAPCSALTRARSTYWQLHHICKYFTLSAINDTTRVAQGRNARTGSSYVRLLPRGAPSLSPFQLQQHTSELKCALWSIATTALTQLSRLQCTSKLACESAANHYKS